MDGWERWRVACLSVLSVWNIEDRLSADCSLRFSGSSTNSEDKGPQRLPLLIFEGKTVATHIVAISELKVELSDLKRDVIL